MGVSIAKLADRFEVTEGEGGEFIIDRDRRRTPHSPA